MNDYTTDYFSYNRRKTWTVTVGDIPMGSDYPIRIQSMTNTNTLDTKTCVEQSIRLANAGCEYVRIAAQGILEAENLRDIKKMLYKQGYRIPLIADVHFNPKVALLAAEIVEKVRINPGNYADKKQFKQLSYTEKEYEEELERIANRLHPLLRQCTQNGTALRIGTNHGSLSDRIISRYGNSPQGMAISAMEYVRICHDFGFHNLVLSMKASDIRITIQSVRLLASMLEEKQWHYPLHLGVTEAGNGEYGRIKSATGIGVLLQDGLGDTLRVSLTENPENELPLASMLATLFTENKTNIPSSQQKPNYNPYHYVKRESKALNSIGGDNKPVIFSPVKNREITDKHPQEEHFHVIHTPEAFFPNNCILLADSDDDFPIIHWRKLYTKSFDNPVVFKRTYKESNWERFYIRASIDMAVLAIDGLADGIWIENIHFPAAQCYQLSLDIVQVCGLRYSKAEFISCPSCGRTQYNIETFLNIIKEKTSHLKGLKIAVMGCIVNGPGEMSDADYGFVGSGKGKITLYKGKHPVYRNLNENNAVEMLIQLIKDNGDWVD
ncbi:MAG: (E)-4-hydroxy-3-methylbut-2-enyl-diphosphate synthase [Bacteroidales bacterium]|jgi:(E)-4-hydroxy-3-methylbut-2-enyl-diphosphate synthase|nr:(E)-4-hydroxy-3-methylbut-2-enyl-diphosphate synthase [Bacteroidales bacterium]